MPSIWRMLHKQITPTITTVTAVATAAACNAHPVALDSWQAMVCSHSFTIVGTSNTRPQRGVIRSRPILLAFFDLPV